MAKTKFNSIYETIGRKNGTYHYEPSKTDKTQAADAEIYKCIEKYGVQSLMRQTIAKEQLYLDNTNAQMTLADAMRQREQMEEYFANLPARARKVFGDNPDTFIERYKAGKFDKFLATGTFTEEQIKEIENIRKLEKEAQYQAMLEDERYYNKWKERYEKGLEVNNNNITGNDTNSIQNTSTTL